MSWTSNVHDYYMAQMPWEIVLSKVESLAKLSKHVLLAHFPTPLADFRPSLSHPYLMKNATTSDVLQDANLIKNP